MKLNCPSCANTISDRSEPRTAIRTGTFWRKSDGRRIQRFRCFHCQKGFSQATGHACFNQNKRHKNELIRKLLGAAVSQREAARVAGVNRKTVVRKLLFWAKQAKIECETKNRNEPLATRVQFDDLESFEHSKCKPLSVTLMVEEQTRRILGFEVAKMPAKGLLAKIARKKYGPRPDERASVRAKLFQRVQPLIHPNAQLRSDSNPHYSKDVRRYFPNASYDTVIGKRGAVTGQGELKKVKWDPIFSLNHTCAMLRAHLSRLLRKTWNTTKKAERLDAHLWVYMMSHNRRISGEGI